MVTETRTTDKKARVSLPKAFADCTVIIEQVSDTEVRIRKARVIPEDEIRFYEETREPLSVRDAEILLALLENPPPANEALRRAYARYKKSIMDEWQIERLNNSHERAEFSCGKPPLDDFIRARASQYERRTLGRTYVAVPRGGKKVVGYYTLCSGAIPFEHLPPKLARKLPKHPLPAILLGRLAVDQSVQGRRLGELLLIDALRLSLTMSEQVGVYAVEVQAIDEQAKRFYEKYQFLPLADDDRHLYLPIPVIEDMIRRG